MRTVILRMFDPRRMSFVAIALLTMVSLTMPVSASTAVPGARLVVQAPSAVRLHQPIVVGLAVTGATDLAGYEATATYDVGAAHFGGVRQLHNDIAAGGRGVVGLGPEESGTGVAFGMYSCPAQRCTSRVAGVARAGANGTVRLAYLTIVPDRAGRLEIRLGGFRFVDTRGNTLAVAASTTVLVVKVGSATQRISAPTDQWTVRASAAGQARSTDLTTDGLVTNSDAMEVVSSWMLARSAAAPCRAGLAGDVNGDGCVTVEDAQSVAAHYSSRSAQRPARVINGNTIAATPTPLTFVVNSTSDAADANAGDEICATASSVCSLRAAIQEANLHTGPDTINFGIAGTGVKQISLSSTLPTIADETGPTTINGYTQTGASPNTSALADNAVIRIEILGASESSGWPNMTITSPDNVIRGIAEYRHWRGITLIGPDAHNNSLVGIFVGTNAAGTYGSTVWNHANGGIYLNGGANHNDFGLPNLADRTLISGNPASGIYHVGEGTNANNTRNDLIGLTPSGTARRANILEGVDFNGGASFNIVGGTGPLEHNVSSGNAQNGVEMSHGTDTVGNRAIGNYIGTDVTGNFMASYTVNGNYGVQIEDGVQDTYIGGNVIGNGSNGGIHVSGFTQGTSRGAIIENNRVGISLNGTAIANRFYGIVVELDTNTSRIGPGNIVTNNPIGIAIRDTIDDAHTITGNSIYGNTGLGIDLQPVGSVNVNDFADVDTGANEQLNFPAFTSATVSTVKGSACGGCTVEIFKADSGANLYGEGRTLVGSGVALANGRFTLGISGVAVGDYLTSTATDAQGNTSEFSLNKLVTSVALPIGSTVAGDDFERSTSNGWGQATNGGHYTLYGLLADFNVSGGWGRIRAAAGQTRVASLLSTSVRDVDLQVRLQTDKAAAGGNESIYLVGRQTALGTEYRAKARIAPTGLVYLSAWRVVNNVETQLGAEVVAPNVLHSPGAIIQLRTSIASADPTQIDVKAWMDGSAEPAAWQLSVLDASTQLDLAGAAGLRIYLQSGSTNGPVSFAFDAFAAAVADAPVPPVVADFSWHQETDTLKVDFTDLSSGSPDTWAWDFGDGSTSNAEHPSHTYASANSYQVTLTATAGVQSDSKTATVVVDPVSPPPPIVYASDNFSRTVSGGWGNAGTGGPWTSSSGSSSLSVDGATGNMSVATGATRAAYLSSVSVLDIDMTSSVQTDKLAVGGAQYVYLVGRHINPTNDYTAKLRFTTNDQVIVGVSRFSAGVETALGAAVTVPGLTHVAGQAVMIRVQMTGANPTTIQMKVWQAGTAEPATWLLTVTDGTADLQAAGAVGIRSYLGGATTNGPVGYSYDAFQVTNPQP